MELLQSFPAAVIAGLIAGALTGAGLGGGTLLLLWLELAGTDVRQAQGVGLLCFLASAAPAVWGHRKSGLTDSFSARWAALAGTVTAALSSLLCAGADTGLLRKGFGALCLVLGVRSILGSRRSGRR